MKFMLILEPYRRWVLYAVSVLAMSCCFLWTFHAPTHGTNTSKAVAKHANDQGTVAFPPPGVGKGPSMLPMTAPSPRAIRVASPEAEQARPFLPQRPDETVVFDFASQGCFHSTEQRFEISGLNLQVVRVINRKNGRLLRKVAVDEAVLRELDRTMEYYRSHPKGGCTTIDTLRISFHRGRKQIWTENYEDDSCQTTHQEFPLSMPDVFDEQRRLRKDSRISRRELESWMQTR